MSSADTNAAALQRAHAAAYKLAQAAHMDGCQMPTEAIYEPALQSLVLAEVLQKELSRASFAVVGTCAALRNLGETHAFITESALDGIGDRLTGIHSELEANSRTTVEALRVIDEAMRQPTKGKPCRPVA